MKEAEQANCESDRSLLIREEIGEKQELSKRFTLNAALEYSKEAVQKIPESELASLLDQQSECRHKYSDQGANWIAEYPTDRPGVQGSIAAEQLFLELMHIC
ncbi:hypothetical protein O6H91_06G014200 [Diphasiastrum complanatum]|uniref:Uncharacterized protein n=1 Tax=Diphasiastrum complanatum TaxID=34168 RepID=A0ACC2DAT8_DIPCM|nr:hypothetical protein O6H91_06G014200 [Diphasiastrum complanatum]